MIQHATIDPWVADAGPDPVREALRLARIHARARDGAGARAAGLRAVVDRSWDRSAAAGVDPEIDRAPVALGADAIERRRRERALLLARRVVDRSLGDLVAGGQHLVAVAGADGTLLWVEGGGDVVEQAGDELAFVIGADWSEQANGTNAVGTAIAEDHALQIFSAEHFRPSLHAWTCTAAPVHDPASGRVVAVIDVTADLQATDPRTLSLVAGAARAVDAALAADARARHGRLAGRAEERRVADRRPVIGVDHDGRVAGGPGVVTGLDGRIGEEVALPDGRTGVVEHRDEDGVLVALRRPGPRVAPAASPPPPSPDAQRLALLAPDGPAIERDGTTVPLRRGGAEVLAVLADHPQGLTADRLAVLLHADAANVSTARAACSRLRTQVPGVLLARPYRLAPGVRTDLGELRALLAAGRIADAVRGYPGPLLPDSRSAGIQELSETLHAEVRGALLEARDPEALLAWCARPHGAEDLVAAEALVDVLPRGDARRGAAAGRAVSLRRRLGLPPR